MDISLGWTGLLMSLLLLSAYALADQAAKAEIESSGEGYNGVIMINQAAGNTHQQANARSLSIGEASSARIAVSQTQDYSPVGETRTNASANIKGNSFSNGAGVLGINQSAGSSNQHINAFRIEIGSLPVGLDDRGLAQSAASLSANSGAVVPQGGDRRVEIDDQAFSGSTGVVQLNQSAGVGNSTLNHLGIRIMD